MSQELSLYKKLYDETQKLFQNDGAFPVLSGIIEPLIIKSIRNGGDNGDVRYLSNQGFHIKCTQGQDYGPKNIIFSTDADIIKMNRLVIYLMEDNFKYKLTGATGGKFYINVDNKPLISITKEEIEIEVDNETIQIKDVDEINSRILG